MTKRKGTETKFWMKSLTVIIVGLILSVTFTQSITANTKHLSSSKELVEITIEFCGIDTTNRRQVSLTTEQAEQLDTLITTIKEKLAAAKTREETVAVFHDAIVSLDELGMLGDMSIEEAQRLVIGDFQRSPIYDRYERLLNGSQATFGENKNFCCLVAGSGKNMLNIPSHIAMVNILYLLSRKFSRISKFLAQLTSPLVNYFAEKLPMLYEIILYALGYSYVWSIIIYKSVPFLLRGSLSFGSRSFDPGDPIGPDYCPTNGWIWTLGLLGKKTWDGSLYGHLIKVEWIMGSILYIGVSGFAGISISDSNWFQPLADTNTFFLGSARLVNLGYRPPDW